MYKKASLRSKRFRLVSEQRNTEEGTFGFDRARNETRAKKRKRGRGKGRKKTFLSSPPTPRSFTCAIFLGVFDSRSSFFSPKPQRNACYAGYKKRAVRAEMLFCFSLDYYIIIVGFRNVSNKIQ